MPIKRYTITTEIKGEIMGVRAIQDRGRIQIPKKVREMLGLNDGDRVYWIHGLDGRICIAKACEII